jgi:hypothetical protein
MKRRVRQRDPSRNDDKDHESHPSLPTLTDGLRTEEVIEAAAGRVTLAVGRPWADEGALEGNNGD